MPAKTNKETTPGKNLSLCNPGSTSTKIAVYQDETPLFVESIEHSQDELKPFENIIDQYEMRKDLIVATMEKNGVHKEDLTAIVSRGGDSSTDQGRCLQSK